MKNIPIQVFGFGMMLVAGTLIYSAHSINVLTGLLFFLGLAVCCLPREKH